MNAPIVQRGYVRVGKARVHYRRVGTRGPVLVALHPSPLSSAFVMPLALELGREFQVLALDTPGYGLSCVLDQPAPELADYAQWLGETLDALGLRRVIVYGQATGAQIALEFARRAPERVAFLALEGCGYFAPDELAAIADEYLPPMELRADGGHLAQVWTQVRDLNTFFPWCQRDETHALDRDPAPLAAHHAIALDYLRAGAGYAKAYRAALRAERTGMLDGITVPAVIVRAAGSVIGAYTDRMQDSGLPPHIAFEHTGAAPAERAAVIRAHVLDHAADVDVDSHFAPMPDSSWRFVSLDGGGELHVRGSLATCGTPTLLLHAPGLAMRGLPMPAHLLAGDAPVIAMDLPGHGESSLPADWDDADPGAATIRAISQVLDGLDCGKVNLHAFGASARLAFKWAHENPTRIGHIALADAPPTGPNHEPDLSPRWDGAHLLTAWFRSRDGRLYQHWDRRLRQQRRSDAALDAVSLHDETLARLCCRLSASTLDRLADPPGWMAVPADAPATTPPVIPRSTAP